MELAAGMVSDVGAAHTREIQMLVVEGCGLFWIAAELLILLFVSEAHRHILRRPTPPRLVWDRRSTIRAVSYAAFFAVIAAAVAGRAMLWTPLHVRLQSGPMDVEHAALVDALAVRRHLFLWAAFVTLWVVLEIAIVFQGWRAFQALAARLAAAYPEALASGSGWKLSARGIIIVLCGAIFFLLSSHAWAAALPTDGNVSAAWDEIVRNSEEWLSPWRNALYLYLRIAGLVWITVEWVATVVLWRTHSLLARMAKDGGVPT